MKNCYDLREDIRPDNTEKPPLDSEINVDMREEISTVENKRVV